MNDAEFNARAPIEQGALVSYQSGGVVPVHRKDSGKMIPKKVWHRPLLYEAMQFTPASCPDIFAWIGEKHDHEGPCGGNRFRRLPRGGNWVHEGDWLVVGIADERGERTFDVCSPKVFVQRYEERGVEGTEQ